MGYSYNADQAHQRWVEWAKNKALGRLADQAMASGSPAFMQSYGTALSNTSEGRFGTGAALASGLINAGSHGLAQQNFENSLKLSDETIKNKNLDILSEQSQIGTTRELALANKYNAEAGQANYISQFFKANPDILKSYFDFKKKASQQNPILEIPDTMMPSHEQTKPGSSLTTGQPGLPELQMSPSHAAKPRPFDYLMKRYGYYNEFTGDDPYSIFQ